MEITESVQNRLALELLLTVKLTSTQEKTPRLGSRARSLAGESSLQQGMWLNPQLCLLAAWTLDAT